MSKMKVGLKTVGHEDTLALVATLRLIGPTKMLLAAATRLYLKDAGRKRRPQSGDGIAE